MKVLVTGAAGFICGYLVEELLARGYEVVELDKLSKYGEVSQASRDNSRYLFERGDAKDASRLTELLRDCDHLVAGAVMIGGISYFHEFAYDLLAEATPPPSTPLSGLIEARLQKITVLSSLQPRDRGRSTPVRSHSLGPAVACLWRGISYEARHWSTSTRRLLQTAAPVSPASPSAS